jgi:DNA-binding GntR family transcriptional regulator
MTEKLAAILPRIDRNRYATLQEWVYQELRQSIMTGRFVPGRNITLRSIAHTLKVSPMPVRDAFGRLITERALDSLSNGRIAVPRMSLSKFQELCETRIALETLAAQRALPHVGENRLSLLRQIDSTIDAALAEGDVETLLVRNYEFHFTLYRSAPSQLLIPMIETLWLQLGPFMRLVLGRIGVSYLTDRHVEAMDAIERRDPVALRNAIESDIRDGIGSVGEEELLDRPD